MDDLFLENAAEESAQPDEHFAAEGLDASRAEGGMTRRERHAKPRPTLFAANCMYLLAGAGLVLMQLIAEPLSMLIAYIFPSISMEKLLLAVNSPYYILCLLLPVALYAATHGAWESMRLAKLPKWRHVWRALLAAVVAVPLGTCIAALWQSVLQTFGLSIVEESFYIPTTGVGFALMAVSLGVLPGVCEELAFRSLALSAWEQRGTLRAMLITSLLFASLHGSVAGFPTQFLLGGLIAVIAVGSGSAYTGMIFHSVYNTLLLAMAVFTQGAETVTEAELTAAEEALFSGIGLAILAVTAILAGLAMFFILRGIWPRKDKIDLTYGADDWERPEEREFEPDDEPGVELIPRTRGQMSWHEFLVLLSGVVTVIFLYGQDFLNMLGGGA